MSGTAGGMQSEVTQQPYVPEAREGHADGRLRIHPLGLAVIRHAALCLLAFAQNSNITAQELANSAGRLVPSPCAARSWNLYPLEWQPTIYSVRNKLHQVTVGSSSLAT